MLHRTPFQCSINGKPPLVLVKKTPTVQMLRVETSSTPLRELFVEPGALGLGTMLHLVPFQCSIRVCSEKVPLLDENESPTAQMSRGEIAVTALRKLAVAPAG